MLDRSDGHSHDGYALRRVGLIILLSGFAHSYFIVGSLRNALGVAALEGSGRFFALIYGLGWIVLLFGGVLLTLRKNAGMMTAQMAAGSLVLVQVAGLIKFWNGSGPDLMSFLFTLSRPMYCLFLLLFLRSLSRDSGTGNPVSTLQSLAILFGGALLPWCAALIVTPISSASFAQAGHAGFFISIFMSAWCALPFGVLILTIKAWPNPSTRVYALVGGFAGTAVASLYCYGMIWAQNFNSFLMAILPPIVFAGQVLGLVLVMLGYLLFAKSRQQL